MPSTSKLAKKEQVRACSPLTQLHYSPHSPVTRAKPLGSITQSAFCGVQYDSKLCGLLEEYEKCFIVVADNVGSKQFQDIRRVMVFPFGILCVT